MDDMILPDDFEQDTTPIEEKPEETQKETVEDFAEESETTIPTEETKVAEPQTIRIKVDREEQDITIEEAKTLAQKGKNYERAVERAAQEARDAVIAEMNLEWQGQPIRTEAEYRQALAEKEIMDRYQDRDVPPEVIKELMESRKFREEQKAEKAKFEALQKREQLVNEFVQAYPNVEISSIKPETWAKVDKGEMSLKHAYMEQEVAELREKMKVMNQNQNNQQRAPIGSVTAHGGGEPASEDDFIKGFNSV